MNGLPVGWLKMFEERFGRVGKLLTTVLLLLGVLAFAAFTTAAIYLFWGRPLIDLGSKLLEGNDVSTAARTLLSFVVTTALPIIVLWLLWRFYFRNRWENVVMRVAATGHVLSSTREQSERLDTELRALQERIISLGTTDALHFGTQSDIYGHVKSINEQILFLLGEIKYLYGQTKNLRDQIGALEKRIVR